jgi:AMP nucleosidase
MVASGIKTQASDKLVTEKFAEEHVRIGIETLNQLIAAGMTVKHLRFD